MIFVSIATHERGFRDDIQSMPNVTLSVFITAFSISGKLDFPSIESVERIESLLSIDFSEPLDNI